MDKPVKYAASIQSNDKTLQYIQDLMSLVFGTSAGILQLESYGGIAFFAITYFITAVLFIVLVSGLNVSNFYEGGISTIFLNNLVRSTTAFLMSWTLFYALVQS